MQSGVVFFFAKTKKIQLRSLAKPTRRRWTDIENWVKQPVVARCICHQIHFHYFSVSLFAQWKWKPGLGNQEYKWVEDFRRSVKVKSVEKLTDCWWLHLLLSPSGPISLHLICLFCFDVRLGVNVGESLGASEKFNVCIQREKILVIF